MVGKVTVGGVMNGGVVVGEDRPDTQGVLQAWR